MKKVLFPIFILIILSAYASISQSGMASGPEKPDAARKEQYEQSMEERLRRLGRELDELKARADTLAEQARKEARRYVREAEKKRQTASRKLAEMKVEGRKQWDSFSRELNAAMAEFEKACERAKAYLNEKRKTS